MSSRAKSAVPIDELRAVLERTLSRHFAVPQRIKNLGRRRSSYSSSHTIENLEVELKNQVRLRMVFKDLSPGSLLADAQQVRPRFLYDPRREDQDVPENDSATRAEAWARRFSTARFIPRGESGVLVVSRAGDRTLALAGGRVGGLGGSGPLAGQASQRVRWRAATGSRGGDSRTCCDMTETFFRVWPKRAEEFLSRKNGVNSAEAHRQFAQLMDRYDLVVKRLLELPRTFIHGELFPSNVIVRRSKRGRQICPIDWEMAGVAPGLIDLAALTSGDWPEGSKEKMVCAYREAREPLKNARSSLGELMEAVRWCQLHLAVQFLGWAVEWSPPEQQARNWLREALRLAKTLGL